MVTKLRDRHPRSLRGNSLVAVGSSGAVRPSAEPDTHVSKQPEATTPSSFQPRLLKRRDILSIHKRFTFTKFLLYNVAFGDGLGSSGVSTRPTDGSKQKEASGGSALRVAGWAGTVHPARPADQLPEEQPSLFDPRHFRSREGAIV